MTNKTINLCSDTVTVPCPKMLDCMINAAVGDDVLKTDPTVKKLEKTLADMFGREAALFFPSGTMANQTALKLHAGFGDQLICDKWAHIYNYEGGAAAAISGITTTLIDGDRGMFSLSQLKEKINTALDQSLEALKNLLQEKAERSKAVQSKNEPPKSKKVKAVSA